MRHQTPALLIVFILLAGVIGGLVMVVCVILLCKYCYKHNRRLHIPKLPSTSNLGENGSSEHNKDLESLLESNHECLINQKEGCVFELVEHSDEKHDLKESSKQSHFDIMPNHPDSQQEMEEVLRHFEHRDIPESSVASTIIVPNRPTQRALPLPPGQRNIPTPNRLYVGQLIPRRHSDNGPYEEPRKQYNQGRERSGSHNPCCSVPVNREGNPRTPPTTSPRRYSRHLKPVDVSWAKHSHSLEMVAHSDKTQNPERKVRSFDFDVKEQRRYLPHINRPSNKLQEPRYPSFSSSGSAKIGVLTKCSSLGCPANPPYHNSNIYDNGPKSTDVSKSYYNTYVNPTPYCAKDMNYYGNREACSSGKVRYNDTGSLEDISDGQQMLDEIVIDMSDEEGNCLTSRLRSTSTTNSSKVRRDHSFNKKSSNEMLIPDIWKTRSNMSSISSLNHPNNIPLSYHQRRQHSLQNPVQENPYKVKPNETPVIKAQYPGSSKPSPKRCMPIEIRIEEPNVGKTYNIAKTASRHARGGEQHKLLPKAAHELKRQSFRNLQQRRSQRINMSGETSLDSFDTTIDSEPDVSDVSRGHTTTSFESTDNTDSTGDSNTSRRQLIQHDSGYKSLENQDSVNAGACCTSGKRSLTIEENEEHLNIPSSSPRNIEPCQHNMPASSGEQFHKFQLPLIQTTLDARLRPPSPIPKSPDSDASTRRQQFIRDRKTIQINETSLEDNDSDKEETALEEKTDVFDRFFKYQTVKERPPLVQIRDYSIDEKTNSLFNDFLREDPQLDRRAIEAQVRKNIRLQRRYESDGTDAYGCRVIVDTQQYRSASYCTPSRLQRDNRVDDDLSHQNKTFTTVKHHSFSQPQSSRGRSFDRRPPTPTISISPDYTL